MFDKVLSYLILYHIFQNESPMLKKHPYPIYIFR